MGIYIRKDFDSVCSNQYARDYFSKCGLTYDDITEGDILVLVMLLNKELKKSNKNHETSTGTLRLSKRIDFVNSSKHTCKRCFLYMNSHYFTQRECISFNQDGFIGFAGWADTRNTNPILRAFLKWCDVLKEQKEDSENDKS